MFRPAARVGKRGLCRLLHYVPQVAGEGELTPTRDAGGLNEQNVASRGRPRETRRHAYFVVLVPDLLAEAPRTEVRPEFPRVDRHLLHFALGDAARYFAAHGGDLALEIAHACLAGVAV